MLEQENFETLDKVLRTKEEFRAFFQAIPEELFIKGNLTDDTEKCHCALGWLGVTEDRKDFICPDIVVKENVLNLAAIIDEYSSEWPKGKVLDFSFETIHTINDDDLIEAKQAVLNALK